MGLQHPGSAPKPGWFLHLVPLETAGDDKSLPSCVTGSAAFAKPSFPTELSSRAGPEAVSAELCSPGSSARGVSPCPGLGRTRAEPRVRSERDTGHL